MGVGGQVFLARLEDLVGGAEIQRFELAPAGQTPLRQTALPYLTSVDRTWTGGMPDQFRTSLHIQVERADRLGGTPIEIINKTLYADELYGRRLTLAVSCSTVMCTAPAWMSR